MVKRRHKPISESEIATLAHRSRQMKVRSAQRLPLTGAEPQGKPAPGQRWAQRGGLSPPAISDNRPFWSVRWFVDPKLGGARKTVAHRFI